MWATNDMEFAAPAAAAYKIHIHSVVQQIYTQKNDVRFTIKVHCNMQVLSLITMHATQVSRARS